MTRRRPNGWQTITRSLAGRGRKAPLPASTPEELQNLVAEALRAGRVTHAPHGYAYGYEPTRCEVGLMDGRKR